MPKALFIAFLVVAIAFSGCSSKKGGPAADSTTTTGPQSTIDVTQTIDPTLHDKGRVKGLVHDSANETIPGAHVALFGTEYFDVTGADGLFLLDNVTPGNYQLYVDRTGYKSVHRPVSVQASHVVNVDVLLTLLAPPNNETTAHRHDWWLGESSLTIMDRDIDTGAVPMCAGIFVQGGGFQGCGPDGEVFIYLESPPDPTQRPNIVYEGTGRMKIEVTISGQLLQPFEVFALVPPRTSTGTVTEEEDHWVEKGTIDTATDSIEFDVAKESWDPPHFRISGWAFLMRPHTAAGPLATLLVSGTMHWKITVFRGTDEIPLAEPHPNYWGAATNITLMNLHCTATVVPGFGYAPYEEECLDPTPDAGKLVLVGTGLMRVTLTWENYYPLPVKFGLSYIGANSNLSHPQWTDAPVKPGNDGDTERVFEFNVRGDMMDSPYAKKSKWYFLVWVDQPVRDVAVFNGEFRLKTEIFKETAPAA